MGAYVVWFPHNQIRVLVFRFITLLPAWIAIGGWIALQIWMGAGSFHRGGDAGGVAYLAHVGGALTGIFVAFLFADEARYVEAQRRRRRLDGLRRPRVAIAVRTPGGLQRSRRASSRPRFLMPVRPYRSRRRKAPISLWTSRGQAFILPAVFSPTVPMKETCDDLQKL